MATPNPNQVNTSVLGMLSAVITSVCSIIVEASVQGNILIHKTLNVAIHVVSAGEHIAEAVEGRAEIYGHGLVANGELAERETLLKSKLRLANLEAQETAAATPTPASKAKPANTPKPASKGKPSSKATGTPRNAASSNGEARA